MYKQVRTAGYTSLSEDDYGSSSPTLEDKFEWKETGFWRKRTWRFFQGILVVLSVISLGVFIAIPLGYLKVTLEPRKTKGCENPRIRREWRSLKVEERNNYIQAVQCLQNLPSELVGRGNFYDDLVYIHMFIGSQSHAAASFLPWHRASLHLYELTLTQRCGLEIPIPYWNWELDHQSLETSSIWSPLTGFGGDGSPALPEGVGKGRCVVDGPFANTTRLYWEGRENPHCLGRGFTHYDTGEAGKISGTWFSPEKIGQLKRSENYKEFEKRVEDTVHNALHWSVRGDFSSMTAANEPLFWLHHGQLDRLWWEWQNEKPAVRTKEYQGVSFNTTKGRDTPGSLDDLLEFKGLSRGIKVLEVMETEGSFLCYRY